MATGGAGREARGTRGWPARDLRRSNAMAARVAKVQGFFPLFFVLLFLSSAFFPRNLIEQDWFRTIATYNPVSYMVEGIRSLVITGWDAGALGASFGMAGSIRSDSEG